MKKWLKIIVCALVFCVCVALIVIGQKTVGVKNLLLQLLGLAGILVLLFLYNKKYQ